ncbi:MAG: glycosyltransferase family 39 protein [Armatimonadota bacterium]|nr:glycosyltransferase family 39 protein [Armatimonadota bacterium]
MSSNNEGATLDFTKAMAPVFAVYLLLAMAYISVTPFRTSGCLLSRMTDIVQQDIGAPDERQHTNYVRHLVREKSFPVFEPGSPDLYETYQSHQPPLYYLLAAPAEMAFDNSESSEMWGLRFVNVILGGLVVWGIFVGMRRLTGSGAVGFASAAITAFLPMFLSLSAAVSNDMALFLVAVCVMNVVALGWEKGWHLKNCLLLGALLGLGVLTKTTAVVLIPIAIYGLWARKDVRPKLPHVLAMVALAALIALPWLLRNQSLYGDPLAIGAFQKASVGNLETAVAMSRAGGAFPYWFSFVIPVAIESFWGVFGYFDVFLMPAMYWICNIMGLIMLAGFGWSMTKPEPGSRRTYGLLWLLFLMVVLAFVSYNANYFQAQGRYLYPAIFAIAGAFGIGLRKIAGTEVRTMQMTVAIAAILIAINIYATFYLLPAAFELMQRCA